MSVLFAPHLSAPSTVTLLLVLCASGLVLAAIILSRKNRRLVGHVESLTDRLFDARTELSLQRSDMARFQELSMRLSSSLELSSLLKEVLGAVTSLQKTSMGMVLLLLGGNADELYIEAKTGFSDEQAKHFGYPIAGDTAPFDCRTQIILEDVYASPMSPNFRRAAEALGFRSLFSIPLFTRDGEPLGVVATFFPTIHRPSDREIRMVELFGRQAANAIENARLYQRVQQNVRLEQRRTALLAALADASLQINSAMTLDHLLQSITDQAREIIGAHQSLTTFVPTGDWARSINCVSVSPDYANNARARASAVAAQLAAPALAERASQPGAWTPDLAFLRGWLVAPIVTRDGRNLGFIQVADKMDGEFGDEDRSILVQLAHMAAAAMENVRLYREAQEQITERARAQDALQRSKESLQVAQRAAGIGVWEWDLQDGRMSWSDETCALHAVDSFDGRYESWLNAIYPDDRETVHRAVARALAAGGDYDVHYRVVGTNGTPRWMEIRGQVFHAAGRPARMVGVAMDITSRKQSEEALRTSEKLAATGRLAATIAHEINNPLGSVTNLLYLLGLHPSLDRAAREYVRTAEGELRRVTHITRQTLAFYREAVHPVPIRVPELINEVLEVYAGKAQTSGIAIETEYDGDAEILGYPGELRQVFSNLLLNSLEATPPQGRVWIRVRRAVRSSPARTAIRGVRILIADSGQGIAEDNRSRIFEPFFTTKGEKGTGLGLWVTHGIVAKHGGAIRVRSSSDPAHSGTAFSIFLPAEFLRSAEGSKELNAVA
jgi:PAS domain S-box-containing protein